MDGGVVMGRIALIAIGAACIAVIHDATDPDKALLTFIALCALVCVVDAGGSDEMTPAFQSRLCGPLFAAPVKDRGVNLSFGLARPMDVLFNTPAAFGGVVERDGVVPGAETPGAFPEFRSPACQGVRAVPQASATTRVPPKVCQKSKSNCSASPMPVTSCVLDQMSTGRVTWSDIPLTIEGKSR